MLPEQAIEISKVRFDHAKECLRDAKLLLAGESYRSAANRAYYAIFHAMRAVLALDGVDMKHHSGIISKFRKRYIKTGVFDASLSGLISELSDVREGSDYNDFFIQGGHRRAGALGRDVFGGGRNLSADKILSLYVT